MDRKIELRRFRTGSTNLSFLGQFVEMGDDIVLAVEYRLQGAQEAVYGLLRLLKKPIKVYRGDFMLRKALKSLLEDDTNRSESMESLDRYHSR